MAWPQHGRVTQFNTSEPIESHAHHEAFPLVLAK